ncbi:MAG: two-component system sensor histidine kinase CreC [Candidatus Nitronauta litoralis]|uniref:histidine kinase n=1 Tax=Candidatus Nitronauta litoralis TaxID=2705533 RepID=A0A7T0BVC4_9BACT|nr:MAG: two-component system sensor histidine kinase CreC [Candidatus Nitronauta litoralis]
MKYSSKIFVSIILVLGLGFWGYGYWLMKEIRSQYAQSMEDSLVDFSNVLASYLSAQSNNGKLYFKDFGEAFRNFRKLEFNAKIHGVFKDSSPIHAYVTDEKGIVVFDSRDPNNVGQDYSKWNDVYLTLRGEYGARSTRMDSKDPLSSVYFIAAPIVHSGKIIGVVSVIKPEQSLQKFISQGREKFFSIGLLVVLAASTVAVLFSYWLTRPIRSLLKYAREITGGGKARPPKTGSHEFDNLGQAFDEMRISLEGKKSVENFVQHLTHELKSPLTAIQGAAELLQDDMPADKRNLFVSNIETETKRARRLLDELLSVAELESRSSLKDIERFSVSQMLREITKSFSALIEKKGLQLDISIKGSNHFIKGERLLIHQTLSNLLINAIDFSPEKGTIFIEIDSDDRHIKISIRDQGPGIPEYARERIFEKFFSLERPGTGKKSSGLGLSFVEEALSLHSGTIRLIPTPSGTHFQITIPHS